MHNASWSEPRSFVSLYSAEQSKDKPTKVAIYGDMGDYPWNNKMNVLKDLPGQGGAHNIFRGSLLWIP